MLAYWKTKQSSSRKARIRRRSGVAAVEFAVCLPVLLALVFGTIETSNAIYLQRSLTVAAYEAGSVSAALGGSSNNALTRANAVLSCLGVQSASVSISPYVDANTPTGTTIIVQCSAPLSANTTTNWCLTGRTFTATFAIKHL